MITPNVSIATESNRNCTVHLMGPIKTWS